MNNEKKLQDIIDRLTRAIDIVISIQTLLEEVSFNTQLEFNIGNLKLTNKSYLVMVTGFTIYQLYAVLKEEK